jgi:ketosteroid isomerase-like protein
MESTTRVESGMTIERLFGFFDACNAHDIDRLVDYFTDDGVYLASAGPDDDGTSFRGIDEVRRGFIAFFDTFPDGHYTDIDLQVNGDRGIARWTFTGTTSAESWTSTYRGADVFEFAADKIRVKDAFRKERSDPIGS